MIAHSSFTLLISSDEQVLFTIPASIDTISPRGIPLQFQFNRRSGRCMCRHHAVDICSWSSCHTSFRRSIHVLEKICLMTTGLVERGEWFVHQQRPRARKQRPSNGLPLDSLQARSEVPLSIDCDGNKFTAADINSALQAASAGLQHGRTYYPFYNDVNGEKIFDDVEKDTTLFAQPVTNPTSTGNSFFEHMAT